MNRDQLLRKLRKFARKNGLFYEEDKGRGKGGHYIVRMGDHWTTVQSDLNPLRIERILKQLNIDPALL